MKIKNTSLSKADLGKEVTLEGWVAKIRNFGAITFIDLRDRSGLIQLVYSKENIDIDLRNEYVIKARGTIRLRETPNPSLKTGEIEVDCKEIKVLSRAETTPLIIADETDALEDTRLKYRYLDLRRPSMQRNLDIRNKIKMATHKYLNANDFIEVETPILNLSTPEGARDYLVPSRTKKGSFYALPQSPQIFKQLLMIGGLERYYQIAKCFRDEDLRSDRQPEFTQIDIEVSFMDQDEILSLSEGLIKEIFKEAIDLDINTPFKRITYKEAIDKYGSDHPDTRFDLTLKDIKELMLTSSFEGFKKAESIKCIVVPKKASDTSRKVIDDLAAEGKKFLVDGVIVLKVNEAKEIEGSFTKFFTEALKKELIESLSLNPDDLVIISYGDKSRVSMFLGAKRVEYAKELKLYDESTFDLLWVVDFPLFEKDVEGNITSVHHPFTRPQEKDLDKLESDPFACLSYSYDLIINGYEVGGGSLRIYDQEVQNRVFKVLGLTDEDIRRKFGFFVDAFKYGTPPHGGLAFGLDRLTMLLSGTNNIRDVIAFPKNLNASCMMSGAPTPVDKDQLDELGIQIKKGE
ncbi:MAG: aspartate--tRNA ligase [Coprobacillus sp.]|nr:aspartate--tRNA ligase [Coprobacillus sp.]